MTDTQTKRVSLRWSPPQGFGAVLLFLVLAFFLELLLVASFLSLGVRDNNPWMGIFQIPGTNFHITFVISPMFHLLPLTVIIVLASSWIYLARHIVILVPGTGAVVKRPPAQTRRDQERRRFKALRRFFRRMGRRTERAEGTIRNGFQRIPGVPYLSKRLNSARTAVRSAVTIFLVFVALSLLLYVIVYPNLIYNGVIGLYMTYHGFRSFVLATTDFPLFRGLGNAVYWAFVGAAPGFRQSLAQVGGALTGSIANTDNVSKYVFSQNVAAWAAAIISLVYGMFFSSRRPRKR